jgi:hypothetical protein
MNLFEIYVVNGLTLIDFMLYLIMFFSTAYILKNQEAYNFKSKRIFYFVTFGAWVVQAPLLFIPQPIEAWLFRLTLTTCVLGFFIFRKKIAPLKTVKQ